MLLNRLFPNNEWLCDSYKTVAADSSSTSQRRYFHIPLKYQIYSSFTNLLKTWCVKNLEVLLNGVPRIPLVSSPIPSAISSFDTKKHRVKYFNRNFSFRSSIPSELAYSTSLQQDLISCLCKKNPFISIHTCIYLAWQQHYIKTGYRCLSSPHLASIAANY